MPAEENTLRTFRSNRAVLRLWYSSHSSSTTQPPCARPFPRKRHGSDSKPPESGTKAEILERERERERERKRDRESALRLEYRLSIQATTPRVLGQVPASNGEVNLLPLASVTAQAPATLRRHHAFPCFWHTRLMSKSLPRHRISAGRHLTTSAEQTLRHQTK